MHIIHSLNNNRIDEHIDKPVSFLMTNKRGNYLSFGETNFSHMQGLYFFDQKKWRLFKTVEDIKLDTHMTAIKNNFFNAQRLYSGGVEEAFNLFNDSMVYSVKNYTGRLVLELDFREMFDFHDAGRVYSVTKEGDLIIVKYEKYSDHSLSSLDKTKFLVIKGANNHKHIGEWIKKHYPYDSNRGSRSDFHVYKALSIDVKNHLDLVFSFSDNKKKAIEHAEKVYENKEYLLSSYKKYVSHTFTTRDIYLNAAMKALDDLLISTDKHDRTVGIFAGLPWFYQFWARDELISLKIPMLQRKYYLVKNILFKYLNNISDDGLVPNILPANKGDMKSIDAIGWLFLRLRDYINILSSKKILNDYLLGSDTMKIKRELEKAIQHLMHDRLQNGLIVNNEQETWMDTKPAQRKGACIEIQALFLSMIDFHNHLAGITKSKPLFRALEKETREHVKKHFFKQGILYDCVHNNKPVDTVRPNIFLAYYIYPDLLSKKEWKQAFDYALKDLWLGWGGLSSLGHSHPRFKSEYTGENDESYHNGDSWYYVNNYAALAMHRLDKKYYANVIKRIFEASKEETMFSGFIGCCAEVSSAKHMQSQGCLSQAWSAASFIELWYEMHM